VVLLLLQLLLLPGLAWLAANTAAVGPSACTALLLTTYINTHLMEL
jgi:hypothetical protein